nr:MAG TPA: hypothetical protein [Caudoviricetes sp.]
MPTYNNIENSPHLIMLNGGLTFSTFVDRLDFYIANVTNRLEVYTF